MDLGFPAYIQQGKVNAWQNEFSRTGLDNLVSLQEFIILEKISRKKVDKVKKVVYSVITLSPNIRDNNNQSKINPQE